MLELVGTKPKTPGLHAIVEDCPQSETVGVAMKVGGLDRLEFRGAVVFLGTFRHHSRSRLICLESRTVHDQDLVAETTSW